LTSTRTMRGENCSIISRTSLWPASASPKSSMLGKRC
jgi:hypothetical protein